MTASRGADANENSSDPTMSSRSAVGKMIRMNCRVTLEIAAAVAHVQLRRADKLNALDGRMFAELVETGEHLLSRADVRAIVLSGQGSSFCAGLDASFFDLILRGERLGQDGPTLNRPLATRTHGIANRAQRAATVWADAPVPVIAALQGFCFGGGLQIALGADLRFAAPDARLSAMEIRWGLVPDMGGFVHARRLLRADVWAELVYTGRQIGGEEAVRLGLVTRLCRDPLEEALALAGEIAGRSPDAVRAAKRLLTQAHRSHDAAVLLQESTEQEQLIAGANQLEAIRAHLEKRAPRFSDIAN
jgi:enoyl-CoA hydratase/carnithine racemase